VLVFVAESVGGFVAGVEVESAPTLGDERDADVTATQWVLPHPLPPEPARIRVGWIEQVADAYGVHSVVIIGQLQKRGILDWRTALVRGAPNVDRQLEAWNAE
jgi:HTH-type transcriptional regulator / antitoxin HigA